MSSFFTVPASQRKRKRRDDRAGNPSKRRDVEIATTSKSRSHTKPRRAQQEQEDEISDLEGDSDDVMESDSGSEVTSEEGETAAERRVRQAQRYLENLRQEIDEAGFDAEEIDKDMISQRLKQDVDEVKGRQFRLIAQTLDFASAVHSEFRADTQSTTAVAIQQPYAYTVSKDKTLIKWRIQSPPLAAKLEATSNSKAAPPRRKPTQVAYVKGVKVNALVSQQHGHTGSILSLAVSPDGRYVATGGADKKLIIWKAEGLQPLKTFTTHRDAVTGLDFAPETSSSGFGAQLFSASMDRSLKTYSLAGENSLAYVETLFGHQDHVLAVSAMATDQCVSVGARDKSARLWRVVDETQLKFLGDSSRHDTYHVGSLDCVAALPPQNFVTGSDSGAISLWSVNKKKALFTIQTAHGVEESPPLHDVSSEQNHEVLERLAKSDTRRPIPRAITALASLPGTDVVLSGSWDGWLRAWKLSDDKRNLISLGVVGKHDSSEISKNVQFGKEDATSQIGPVKGVVNSIAILERRKREVSEYRSKKEGECIGLCIIAGTGKEMRLGRWMKFPRGRNGAIVFEVPIRYDTSS